MVQKLKSPLKQTVSKQLSPFCSQPYIEVQKVEVPIVRVSESNSQNSLKSSSKLHISRKPIVGPADYYKSISADKTRSTAHLKSPENSVKSKIFMKGFDFSSSKISK